jgi:hypothetical protein
MHLSCSQMLTLAAAIFGFVGTLFLFFGSYALETGPLNTTFAEAARVEKAGVDSRNMRRLSKQRLGLVFLMISFALGGVSVFVP